MESSLVDERNYLLCGPFFSFPMRYDGLSYRPVKEIIFSGYAKKKEGKHDRTVTHINKSYVKNAIADLLCRVSLKLKEFHRRELSFTKSSMQFYFSWLFSFNHRFRMFFILRQSWDTINRKHVSLTLKHMCLYLILLNWHQNIALPAKKIVEAAPIPQSPAKDFCHNLKSDLPV